MVRLAWTVPPAQGQKLPLAGTPAQPRKPCCFTPLQEKTSGMQIRGTPDIRLRFAGFNFGYVQLLRFVIVMIRSYSFCHLNSVM